MIVLCKLLSVLVPDVLVARLLCSFMLCCRHLEGQMWRNVRCMLRRFGKSDVIISTWRGTESHPTLASTAVCPQSMIFEYDARHFVLAGTLGLKQSSAIGAIMSSAPLGSYLDIPSNWHGIRQATWSPAAVPPCEDCERTPLTR